MVENSTLIKPVSRKNHPGIKNLKNSPSTPAEYTLSSYLQTWSQSIFQSCHMGTEARLSNQAFMLSHMEWDKPTLQDKLSEPLQSFVLNSYSLGS